MSTDYEIQGMRCASCAARVEAALQKVAGEHVAVNFATKRARLPASCSADEAIAAVRAMGYDLTPILDGLVDVKIAATVDVAKHRAQWALGLAALVVVLAMVLPENLPGSAIAQLVLTGLVCAGPGRDIFKRAALLAARFSTNMDSLVAVGSLMAIAASILAMVQGRGALYFETAAVIIAFVLLGRWLEERARGESLAAIVALKDMQVKTVLLVDEHGVERTIAASQLCVDDRFVVRPGEKAAVDGVVVDGASTMDESFVTGEALPVAKRTGQAIHGATINNGTGRLLVEARKTVGTSTLARIVELVEAAQLEKSQVQRVADYVAGSFVPFIFLAAFATFATYIVLLEATWFEAMVPTIAVLVTACPCALGLAIPTALLVATGRGAQARILVRSPAGFERLGSARIFVLDKTGTLTEGRPRISALHLEPGMDETWVLGAAAAAEKSSLHPLAMALIAHAEERGIALPKTRHFAEVAGQGVQATLASDAATVDCLVGKLAFLEAAGVAIPKLWHELAARPQASLFVALAGRAAGAFLVEDHVRAGAGEAVAALRRLGGELVLATGDRRLVADEVARAVGITKVHADLSPQDKAELVTHLGVNYRRVAMIGDGINDAPALAKADVGVAVGKAADIAMDAASLVIPHGDIGKLVSAVRLARKTLSIMRQNLAWAFVYNVAMIPLAAAGKLTPMLAAGAMALSSVSVVLNSLRLRRIPKNL